MRGLLLVSMSLFGLGEASATQIFHDGFEPVGPPVSTIECLQGPQQSAAVGVLPAGQRDLLTCFELRNDRDFARSELAYGSVPVPRAINLRNADLARLVVAGPGDVRMPAQFRIVSRWGSSADVDAAARWLQIALPADVASEDGTVFALLQYDAAPTAAVDALAITVGESNGRWQIDTGLALFELDPANPALFHRIALRESAGGTATDVLNFAAGAPGYGPTLRVGNGSGGQLFEASNAVPGSLLVTDAQLREVGTSQVVVTMDGEFAGGAASRCEVGDFDYASFQWSIEARFARGSRDVALYLLLRHACSDGFGGNWTDQAAELLGFEWGFPLRADAANSGTQFYAGSGAVTAVTGAGAQQLIVEQRRGGGSPWQRRAEVRRPQASSTPESAVAFARPLAALQNDRVLAAISMPWMRFREPQALRVAGDRLDLQMISEPIVVGEGKALWFAGRLGLAAPATVPVTALQQWRDASHAAMERGLLPHAADWVDAGDHWPPLNPTAASAMLAPYQNYMNRHHLQQTEETPCSDPDNFVGGQWDCAKTYGAQLWPDVQFEEQFSPVVNANPAENSPFHNYWNSSGVELFEFLRSGDPRWVWDFAMPQTWLMAQTAALNLGDRNDTIRNGFVVTSTGSGDGQWHRSGFGSDDYNYNRGQHVAFALRPNYPLLERFAAQGRTVIDRYALPRERFAERQQFVDQVRVDRGPMQHFEGLANCAEFVGGAAGVSCHNKLAELLDELAHDNLATGAICQADDPDTPEDPENTVYRCFFGQQFMINSMFYTYLMRMLLNYGDIVHEDDGSSLLRRALVQIPRLYREHGLPVVAGQIDINDDWAHSFDCQPAGDGRSLLDCRTVDIDGGVLFFFNRPQTMALLLMSDWLEPDPQLCSQARTALQQMFVDQDGLGPWSEFANGGWWKGASQAMQSVVFGVGLAGRCVAP